MRKFTNGLIGLAFLLCAFAAHASEPVDVFGVSSKPMTMTIVLCESNSDCASGSECLSAGICIDDITSQPTGLTCTDDFDCDVGSSCQAVSMCIEIGCESDADCIGDPNGELCNTNTGQCVDCLSDTDCNGNPNGEICDTASGICVECIVDADCGLDAFCDRNLCGFYEECNLRLRPAKVRISGRQKRPFVLRMIRITGKGFKPRGSQEACTTDDDCILGERCAQNICEMQIVFDQSFVQDPNYVPRFPPTIEDAKNSVALSDPTRGVQKGRKRLKISIIAGTELDPGPVPIRFGACLGEIDLL